MSVVDFGCRSNAVEGDALRAALGGRDDLVVVNSCAITAQAVKQARQAVRRVARERPGARVVLTGCAAHTDRAAFAAMPEVAAVIGNDRKGEIATLFGVSPHPAPAFGRRARGFVAVQTGCDHACTFCVVPATRGPSVSVPAGAIVGQVRALVDRGCNEVVLTGIDLGGWGGDLPGALTVSGLVERILTLVPDLARLRLSSLDPVEVDDRLVGLFGDEPRLQPHLHLSLQSGADLILRRMKRRHRRADAVRLVERLRRVRPDIAIGADLIAGFPTESEDHAQETLALLDDCAIVHAHVFPYSPRAGTPAARMPQVAPELARARAARLRAAADARRAGWLAAHVGRVLPVLVEGEDGRGHAPDFAPVRLTGGAAPLGAATNRPVRGGIASARIARVENGILVGDPL